MELHIQKLLRSDPDVMETMRSLGIKTRAHGKYPHLIQFTYSQIDTYANKNHPVVVESRGLILNKIQNWDTVAHPFHRFFNAGEAGSASIDWNTARVMEKLDGSLIIVYWYAGVWHAATKGTPDGVAETWDGKTTFAQYFWDSAKRSNLKMYNLIPGWTYCFEVTGESTRIVTSQEGNKGSVTLLAMRDQNGIEQDVTLWKDRLPVVRHFELNNLDEVIKAAEDIDPLSQEGFVVVDGNFNRIKIKSPRYVALHHGRFNMSYRALLELFKSGESEEVMAYFPEIRGRYDSMIEKLSATGREIDEYYKEVCDAGTTTRKDFAQHVIQKVPKIHRGYVFGLYDGKYANGTEGLRAAGINTLKELLEIEEEEEDFVITKFEIKPGIII